MKIFLLSLVSITWRGWWEVSDSERRGHEDVDVEIPQGSHLEFFLDLK